MSHVTQPLRPTGRASPSAAAREGNAAGIAPHRPLPIWGHLLAAGKCGAGCRDVCHHRSPPGWRASKGASLGGRLPRSPPRSPPPPPHCHDGRGSAARGRVGATRGLRRGPTPRAAHLHAHIHTHTHAHTHTHTHTYIHIHARTMHTCMHRERPTGTDMEPRQRQRRLGRQRAVAAHVSIGTCASPSTSAGCTVAAT